MDMADRRWHQPVHRSIQARPMTLKEFLLRCFTWWNGTTFGTMLWTARFGELVGTDEYGNRYYRTRGGRIDPTLGFERRWVEYNGLAEASTIGPAWHGWMHHTVDTPPTEEKVTPRPWWKPHRPNLTGTPAAYRPTGSTLAQNRRPKATGDYKPWVPGR
jgi:NADH:ubiquinone oxidoreductase subunit